MRTLKSAATILFAGSALLAQAPPVIDRELFFGDPEISGAQISPDGKFIAFLKPLNKTRNIWVKRTGEPFAAAKPVTADTTRPIPAFFWGRDGKYILFVQDKGGDENYNVYAVNPSDPAPAGAQVPAARNLTDAKGVRAQIVEVPREEPDIMYVGLNDRDKAWHDLYKVRISTGERKLVRQNNDRIAGWRFDRKGQLRLAVRSADNGDTEVLRVDPDGLKKIYSCNVFETCWPVEFDRNNAKAFFETNKGDAADLIQLDFLDPATGAVQIIESDPQKRVDLAGAHISEVTGDLLATFYMDERLRVVWKDKAYEADFKFLQNKLPGRDIHFSSHTRDEQFWLISASSDVELSETYLFDRKTKKVTFQYKVREKLAREYLAKMEAIRYKSSDGLEIPAYLTLPKGVPPQNLPLMVFPHGGPWARDAWAYHSYAQFLANRGYAVLQPNFRGSTGYGKKFLNAGNRQWGEKMQDDITWGVKYLVAQGIADPKRVGIMGGSYGGYATLAGVAFTPDVYAAAVSIVGPSNLITLLDSIPPYWEAGRIMLYQRMGDPHTPEGKAQLVRQSPLNSAAKIKTPLMVVQGANDPRVNKAESDQIVIALRDRGFPVEYLVAPDEGHGFARPVNDMAAMAAAEKFLATYLGGRFQEGATEEVASRLKETTVDPKTLALTRKADASSVGLPKTSGTLGPGTWNFAVKLQMGAQTIPLKINTTIKEGEGGWIATDITTTPMGDLTDTAVLDKITLALIKRTVKQGPVAIDFSVEGNKASGTMKTGGNDKPISADLGGPLFGDGAGSAQVIACLPLAEGYSTLFRNFDVQKQQPKIMRAVVTGTESVTVPAGTFDAYKVQITAEAGPEKVTIWVAKNPRKPVKLASVMPQMNGAVLTAELSE